MMVTILTGIPIIAALQHDYIGDQITNVGKMFSGYLSLSSAGVMLLLTDEPSVCSSF